jgi:hypothetical protein
MICNFRPLTPFFTIIDNKGMRISMVTVQHVFPLKNEIKNGFAVGNF